MDPSFLLRYGETVLGNLADRIATSDVSVRSAWLRPVSDPTSSSVDVTSVFVAMLTDEMGNVGTMIKERVLPSDLCRRGQSSMFGLYRKRAPKVPEGPQWLGVEFTVSGGIPYVACYRIPDEGVMFPPKMSRTRITPLCRQIAFAGLIARGNDEDEDEEVLDITEGVQRMAGPEGDFFGRGTVDLWLAMRVGAPDQATWAAIVRPLISGARIEPTIRMGDGSELRVDLRDFNPPQK